MNITSPLFNGVSKVVALPGDSLTSLVRSFGEATGLFGSASDGGLGIVMSGLAGAAAALAVAIALAVYFHSSHRTARDVAKHAIAATIALALAVFALSDMRHAVQAYLGINPSKPAVEFEIRLPMAELSAITGSQIELHTDRNQELAKVEGAIDAGDGQTVLRGLVTLDYRTTDRVVVLSMPGRGQCEFRLRLPAEPSRSDQFGPWHLVDRVTLPSASDPLDTSAHDAVAIRYRVI